MNSYSIQPYWMEIKEDIPFEIKPCPNCGSTNCDELYTNWNGDVVGCSDCLHQINIIEFLDYEDDGTEILCPYCNSKTEDIVYAENIIYMKNECNIVGCRECIGVEDPVEFYLDSSWYTWECEEKI